MFVEVAMSMYKHEKRPNPYTRSRSFSELEVAPPTGSDRIEIPAVRRDVQLKRIAARISHQVDGPRVLRNVSSSWCHVVGRCDVVFGADVNESQRNRWQPRYRIVLVRRAIYISHALVRDEARRCCATNARCTKCVQISRRASLLDLGRC